MRGEISTAPVMLHVPSLTLRRLGMVAKSHKKLWECAGGSLRQHATQERYPAAALTRHL